MVSAVPPLLSVLLPTKVRPEVSASVIRLTFVAALWLRLVPRTSAVAPAVRLTPEAASVVTRLAAEPTVTVELPAPRASVPIVSVVLAVPLPVSDSSPPPASVTVTVSPTRLTLPAVLSSKSVPPWLIVIPLEEAMAPAVPETVRLPASTRVGPVKLLAPESVSVDPPRFVIPAPVPETMPEKLVPTFATRARVPVSETAPEKFRMPVAPSPKVTSPPRVIGLVSVRSPAPALPLEESRPPLIASVPAPKAVFVPIRTAPVSSVKAPVKVLAPESVSAPAPRFVRPKPVPEMTPVSDWPPMPVPLTVSSRVPVSDTAPESVRLPGLSRLPRVTSPPSVTALVSVKALPGLFEESVPPVQLSVPVPRAAALPTWSVPAARATPPVKVLAAESRSVPVPVFASESVPEVPPLAITPAMFVKPVPASVSVRLVVSAAARETPLLTTSVAAPVGLTELLVQV